MRKIAQRFALHVMCLVVAASAAPCRAEVTISIVTENYPPFNFSKDDGRSLTGISIDTVMLMAKRNGINIKAGLFPWSRALQMAEHNPLTCAMSAIRAPDREAKYKWIGPVATDTLALFGAAESQIQLRSIDDARPYVIGTYLGSATIPILERHGLRYNAVADDRLNIQKMRLKRIDLWIASSKSGYFTALQEGIKIKQIFLFENSTDMYLACNKMMPDALAKALNETLKAMRRDGSIKAIEERYR